MRVKFCISNLNLIKYKVIMMKNGRDLTGKLKYTTRLIQSLEFQNNSF